jgi:hypothetical protein
VHDYSSGKADWGSFGLSLEGTADSGTRVSSLAATDAPICELDELVGDVAARLPAAWDVCVVANSEGIVLGLLGRGSLRSEPQARVEEAMTSGPSTIRPSARLDAITERLRNQKLTRMIVTRPNGALVGVLRAEDISLEA